MDSSARLERINFNSKYGGKILEKLSDKIHSVDEGIFYGATFDGTVNTPFNDLENIIISSAPYLLTPIGMYFVYDGIKNKKPYRLGLGLIPALSLLVQCGMAGTGIKGADFDNIKEILNKHTNSGFLSSALMSATVVLTYVGSYFLAKKLVNWKDRLFSKKKIKHLKEKI